MSTNKTIAYRRYAIITVFLAYYSMKELGEKMCEYLKDLDSTLTVTDSKETSVTLKSARNSGVTEKNLKSAAIYAIQNLTEDNSRFESHIADTYEFEYDPKYVDNGFVDNELSFRINGRKLVVYIED